MTNYNLFLDDERIPSTVALYMYPIELRKQYLLEKWIIVRNYNEFVKYITENGLPEKISFDHDLADEQYDLKSHVDVDSWDEYYTLNDREQTGYDCAKWLIDYCQERNLALPTTFVHSMNPTGKENIQCLINNYLKITNNN